jgi:hypothetical protein
MTIAARYSVGSCLKFPLKMLVLVLLERWTSLFKIFIVMKFSFPKFHCKFLLKDPVTHFYGFN